MQFAGILVVERSNRSLLKKIKNPRLSAHLRANNLEILVLRNKKAQTIQSQLKPYLEQILTMTVHGEAMMPTYKRLLPHLPFIWGPTEKSLEWATNKLSMRHMLAAFDKKLCPLFAPVTDLELPNLRRVIKRLGFPLITKPTGLASSLLVNQCYYEDELKHVLKKTFKRIKSIYKKNKGRDAPAMLIEQLMEGSMYTIDVYVNARGRMIFCPLVHVVTGRSVGFDDFFGYKQTTPVKRLQKTYQENARKVAQKGIQALGLRSVTCHVEMIFDGSEWKIIEIAARMGGYRHDLYRDAYGFNHGLNDLLNKLNLKPLVARRIKGYSCLIKFYPRKEGIIQQIKGAEVIKSIQSVIKFSSYLAKGERAYFAKNGGRCVAAARLFNHNAADLQGDIRRVEQMVRIETVAKKQLFV